MAIWWDTRIPGAMTETEFKERQGRMDRITRADGTIFDAKLVSTEAGLLVFPSPYGGWYYAERWNVVFLKEKG